MAPSCRHVNIVIDIPARGKLQYPDWILVPYRGKRLHLSFQWRTSVELCGVGSGSVPQEAEPPVL